ncbi:hypothetical protein CR152_16145 [Massilia violaceinigra]|uniref:Peptidase C39-like domain-containing protein n=1 Tax=Massilia violaceinigra TaxID=2045208 RepID=A0A2D2DLN0_9BURK|nr:hypothetical protein [Massilia violaceinigra]ATQ75889.1 hypothetical protein CR152_16145 [Massilia violaceinigra]
MSITSFHPAHHGFKFANQFVNHVVRVPALGIDITTYGRCGGMAFAALDYWHNNLPIPQDTSLPADGTPLGDYIYNRLIQSILANAFKYFDFMRLADHPTWFSKGIGRITREQEFPLLKSLIDQGQPCALALTKSRSIFEFHNDHQVVAYGYEEGDPYSSILIYDNIRPNEEHRLTFTTAYNPGDRPVHHSLTGDWRGFFVEAYAPQMPPV